MTKAEMLVFQRKFNQLDNLMGVEERTMEQTKDLEVYREAETSWNALNNQMNVLKDLADELKITFRWSDAMGWQAEKFV